MELEREGFIYSVRGRGNFVNSSGQLLEKSVRNWWMISQTSDRGRGVELGFRTALKRCITKI